MVLKVLGKTADFVWASIALVLVLLAIYVGLGRQLISHISDYRQDVEQLITENTSFGVSIGSLEGEWSLFTPVIQLRDVSFYPPGDPDKVFFFSSKVSVDVSVVASLIAQQPRLKDLQIHGLNVALTELDNGQWQINGLELKKSTKKTSSSEANSMISLLLEQELITLSDSTLTLSMPGRPTRSISHINAQLKSYSATHEFSGSILIGDQGQRFIFAAKGVGDPLDKENYALDLYGKLDRGTVLHWLPDDLKQKISVFEGVRLQELSVAGEVWARWRDGGLHDINGLFDADSIQLQNSLGKDVAPIENMVGQFQVAFADEGAVTIAIDDFQFDWQSEYWRESQIKVTLIKEGEARPPSVEIFADHVQVKQVLQLLLLSDRIQGRTLETLTRTQMNGELRNLNLRFYPREKSFLVRTHFEDLSSLAWDKLPGISGLSGYLEMTPSQGALLIDSEGAALDFPKYLRAPIYTHHLAGPVTWVLHKNGSELEEVEVKSGFLELDNQDFDGNVAFSLSLPLDGYAPNLKIFANIDQAKINKVSQYLPRLLPNSLLSWLDEGLVSGDGSATLVFNGPLRLKGLDVTDFTLQTDISVDHLYLDYLPKDWPVIKDARGALLINGADVFFNIDQGQVYDAALSDVTGTILENAQGFRDLKLQGAINADTSNVIQFLNDTPISELIGGLTQTWQAEGNVQATLELTAPIHGPSRPIEIRLEADVTDTKIDLTDIDLAVNDINGSVSYDTRFGLYGQDLDCTVMGYAAKANLLKLDQTQSRLFELELESKVSVARLNQWADQGILQFMDGEFDYDLNIWVQRNDRVGGSETDAWLNVRSDLLGVDVAIPAPLNKRAKDVRPMAFKMSLGDFPSQIFVQYGDDFSAALLVDAEDLVRAQYSFTKKPGVIPSTDGIFADGELDFMDWGLWEVFFTDIGNAYDPEVPEQSPLSTQADQDLFVDKVKSVDLVIDRFHGYGLEIDGLDAHVWRADGSWMIFGNSPMVKGRLKVPDDIRPIEINLSELNLPEEEVEEGSESTTQGSIISEAPSQFPNALVKIDHYVYGDLDLGSWSLSARRSGDAYLIEDLRIKIGQLVLTGEGEWQPDGEQTVTRFRGRIKTQDIGELMGIWGYPVAIETSSAGISFSGSWPHSPFDFYMNRLEGDFDVRFKEGRLLDVDATVSALRVLGILNFSNLGRRLRLDFKDLYQEGLSFDRIKGPIKVSKGEVRFNGLETYGPSASFDVNGVMNFVDDEMALDIALTLPLSKNLAPVAGVVAGPLGVFAGVVIDRVIGDQINRLFRTHYEVTGPLTDPDFRIVPRALSAE